MRRLPLYCLIIILFGSTFSCSNRHGDLVDKSPDTSPTQSPQAISHLPAGHPPVPHVPLPGVPEMPVQTTPSAGPTIQGSLVTAAGLQFEIDPAWTNVERKSAMRAAQFRIPPADANGVWGELVLFRGIGGSAEMNIERWIGQFKQPDGKPSAEKAKVVKQTLGSLNVQTLDISGTFSGSMGMMGDAGMEQTGYRMIAAVVEGPGGPWHFKLIGSEATVGKWKDAFDKMIQSLKPVQ